MVADLFHYGHVGMLRQAKEHGDYLLVGVHADETVMSYKRRPIFSMEERVASVEGCRYVDEVVADAPLTIDRAWIERHNINLVLHGDDFSSEMEELCYRIPIDRRSLQSHRLKISFAKATSMATVADVTRPLRSTKGNLRLYAKSWRKPIAIP